MQLQRVPDWVPTWVDESLDMQWEVHYNLAHLGTYDGLRAAWSALKARIQNFYVMRDLAADMGW